MILAFSHQNKRHWDIILLLVQVTVDVIYVLLLWGYRLTVILARAPLRVVVHLRKLSRLIVLLLLLPFLVICPRHPFLVYLPKKPLHVNLVLFHSDLDNSLLLIVVVSTEESEVFTPLRLLLLLLLILEWR